MSAKVNLGADFFDGPSPRLVTVDGRQVWVDFDEESRSVVRVVLDECAHMGERLRATSSGYICPAHSWRYDRQGSNIVAGGPSLTLLGFRQDETALEIYVDNWRLNPEQAACKLSGTESLRLLSHASFLLTTNDERLLFDPWLAGSTYWGAWTQFPQLEGASDALRDVTRVILTHPHPDHFHPKTLELLDRRTPIYFPPFVSEIIPKTLRQMGFGSLNECPWEDQVCIDDSMSFTFLRPRSIWEDSAVLVRVCDWTWLNMNDAGLPLRASSVPGPLDLLTTAFDQGASGYPLTWEMPMARKKAIMHAAKRSTLRSIAAACERFEAAFYAPFAGWWRHNLDVHQGFARQIPHTTLAEVEAAIDSTSTQVIPCVPSCEINLRSMEYTVDPVVNQQLAQTHQVEIFVPPERRKSNREVFEGLQAHLVDLSRCARATLCERVEFKVTVDATDISVCQDFGSQDDSTLVRISVSVPGWIAEALLSDDPTVTWDHIAIGYWGKWSRDPDIYPVNFMRLLQLGYVSALDQPVALRNSEQILNVSMADVIERNSRHVSRVLDRAGLPCTSCSHSTSETLKDAFAIHGLTRYQQALVTAELAAVLAAPEPEREQGLGSVSRRDSTDEGKDYG